MLHDAFIKESAGDGPSTRHHKQLLFVSDLHLCSPIRRLGEHVACQLQMLQLQHADDNASTRQSQVSTLLQTLLLCTGET
jgi:hypothetical protein